MKVFNEASIQEDAMFPNFFPTGVFYMAISYNITLSFELHYGLSLEYDNI
jgi:hypothetical protein